MNLKPIVRMRCRYEYRVFLVMYLAVYAVVALNVLSQLADGGGRNGFHTSGLETATMITIFIVGLHSFRGTFLFCSANGVSRRRIFTGIAVSLGIAATGTALVDTVNAWVFSHFIRYTPIYAGTLLPEGFSSKSATAVSLSASFLLKNLFWCFGVYLILGLFGFLLSLLYYRMNRVQRLFFSIGIPVFALVLFPVLDQAATGGRAIAFLFASARRWIALSVNPAADLSVHLALAVLLAGTAFLLIRRTEVQG